MKYFTQTTLKAAIDAAVRNAYDRQLSSPRVQAMMSMQHPETKYPIVNDFGTWDASTGPVMRVQIGLSSAESGILDIDLDAYDHLPVWEG